MACHSDDVSKVPDTGPQAIECIGIVLFGRYMNRLQSLQAELVFTLMSNILLSVDHACKKSSACHSLV